MRVGLLGGSDWCFWAFARRGLGDVGENWNVADGEEIGRFQRQRLVLGFLRAGEFC